LLAGFAILAAACARGVTRTTSYRAPDGSLVYVGEAYNNGASDLDNATIEATFYDAAGNVTRTEVTYPCRVMAKNSASPFELRLPPGTADPARVGWKVTGEDVPSVYLAEGLTAEIHTTLVRTDGTSVFGEIRNSSANTYIQGYLCIGWRDGAGNVARMGESGTAALRLGPGEAAPFAVFAELPAQPLEPVLYLDAGVTPAGFPQPQFVDLPMSAFQHSVTLGPLPPSFHGTYFTLGIGEIRNTTSSVLLAQMVAVTRDASGRVLSANADDDLCDVVAPPGGFTIGSWSVDHAGPSSPAPALSIQAIKAPSDQRVVISTTSVTKSTAGGDLKISGKVKNTSSKTLLFSNVCAIAYGADGNVIGAMGQTLFPDGGLAPGGTEGFSIEVPTVGPASTVKAIADGVPEP
jgi:hypothetical protein